MNLDKISAFTDDGYKSTMLYAFSKMSKTCDDLHLIIDLAYIVFKLQHKERRDWAPN